MKIPQRFLFFLSIFFLVQLALLWQTWQVTPLDGFFSGDTASYLNSAHALLQTGHFWIAPDQTVPQVIRTPGYPLFMAGIFFALGENFVVLQGLQVALNTLLAGLVFWLAARLYNQRVAWLAFSLFCLNLVSIGFAFVVITETLFTFFLLFFTLLAILVLQNREFSQKIFWISTAAGLALAVATHIRPVSYYLLFPVLVGWLGWWLWQKHPWRRLTASLVPFLLPWLVLVGGWQVRNSIQTGSAQFSAIENINLVNYRAAMVIAERDDLNRDAAMQEIYTKYHLPLQGAPGWNSAWRAAGARILLENPLLFAKQYLQGLMNIFIGPGSEVLASRLGVPFQESSPLGDLFDLPLPEYWSRWAVAHPVYFGAFWFSLTHMLFVYLGVVLWLARILCRRKISLTEFFILAVTAYLALVSAGPEAYYRFRVPMMPYLVVLAAGYWDNFFQRQKHLQRNQYGS